MPDTFRISPRALSEDEKGQVSQIKELAEQLQLLMITGNRGARECALATTKLEEAVMWAIKGIGT